MPDFSGMGVSDHNCPDRWMKREDGPDQVSGLAAPIADDQ